MNRIEMAERMMRMARIELKLRTPPMTAPSTGKRRVWILFTVCTCSSVKSTYEEHKSVIEVLNAFP